MNGERVKSSTVDVSADWLVCQLKSAIKVSDVLPAHFILRFSPGAVALTIYTPLPKGGRVTEAEYEDTCSRVCHARRPSIV